MCTDHLIQFIYGKLKCLYEWDDKYDWILFVIGHLIIQ